MSYPAIHDAVSGDDPRIAMMLADLQALDGMLHLAQALAASGQELALAGLENHVGRLCATMLDLPPADGRQLRARLRTLQHSVEALSATLRAYHTPSR